MLHGHGGNRMDLARQLDCAPEEIIDMSSNINPLGPPPGLIRYLSDRIAAIGSFPEVDGREISERFAANGCIDPERVLAGNGTTQIIYSIPRALGIRRALIVGPTYSDYADACRLHNVETAFALAEASNDFRTDIDRIKTRLDQVDAVFICNPNNPTGMLISPEELKSLCRSYPQTVFIVDESYLPFVAEEETLSLRKLNSGNLMILSSISKIFAIPGLRIGFVISHAEMIKKFRRFLQPWSVNSLAQLAVGYLMSNRDDIAAYLQKTHHHIRAERGRFGDAFNDASGIRLFPSTTNFILLQLPSGIQAEDVIRRLARDKILIRNCRNFVGLSNRYIRISLQTGEVNQMVAAKLSAMVPKTAVDPRQPHAKIRIGG